MTQRNVLELAKQGNANAIAHVISYVLKNKGITAKALLKDSCLLVMLESTQEPDRESSVISVRTAMRQLGVQSIRSVKIYGKVISQDSAAWTKVLHLHDLKPDPPKTASLEQTPKVELEAAKEQDPSIEVPKPAPQTSSPLWPTWFPYPSSWLRALILVPIAFPGAILIDIAFGGILLSIIQNNRFSLIIFTLLGLFLPTIFLSFIYHIFWFRWHKPPALNRWFKCWQDSSSWWEGLYATFVIGLSFLSLVTIFIAISHLACSVGHQTTEELYGCTGQGLGNALRTTFESIKNIWGNRFGTVLTEKEKLAGALWCGIWLTIAAYLYQAEYLIRKRFNYQLLAKILLSFILGFWVTQVLYLGYSTWGKFSEASISTASQTPSLVASAPAAVPATPVPSQTPFPAESAPATSQTPSPQPDSFRQAVNKAMSAANLTQSAKLKQDWKAVASQWQEAIGLMKAVPASSPNYAVAQKKVVEYQKNLDFANLAARRAK